MGVGSTVTALLETYSNCLALLKAFKRRGGDAGRSDDKQSLLRRSIRSDRAKVRRAYSTRLSERGARLEKGDGPAKSALRRILKKLTNAIVNLLHTASKNQNPVMDYESLMTLSNSSRIDAIRAIDQLSHRLGSNSSRSSMVVSSTGSSRHRRHRSSTSSTSTSTSTSRHGHSNAVDKQSKKVTKERERDKSKSVSKEGIERPAAPSPGGGESRRHSRGGSSSTYATASLNPRISMISTSTDSTKLGEIPERKWRSRHEYESSSGEYSVQPMYPLKPYKPEIREKKGWAFWRR